LSSFLDNKNVSFIQLIKSGSPKIKPPIKFLCEFSTAFTSLNQTGFNVNIDYLRCDNHINVIAKFDRFLFYSRCGDSVPQTPWDFSLMVFRMG